MGKLHFPYGDYLSNSKDMDAIVNSANKYMTYGSGISGVIYKDAGNELEEYCKNNYKEYMKVTEVRITPGFNINSSIIHVLAPKFYEEEHPIEKLIETYQNVLDSIKNNNYKNVLLCSLGAGVHGYKDEVIAKPVITLLNNFCNKNDVNIYFNSKTSIIRDIYLNEYIKLNNINIKDDLSKLDNKDILEYLYNNGLEDKNAIKNYKTFCKNKELDELCLSEKLTCLEYTLENFDIDRKKLDILINSL